ncbi:MAG: polysaccharide deacetylase family protein [Myxococcales bacterium]|nr:polysaccharide deacetylase family protein [Polyangiaceae bacterium]MDW8250622.1 polysaccharide deacetylase family protein [Myxococcales bacterium]
MLCAISVDLDEIGQYHKIHGLPPPRGEVAYAVYRLALDRWEQFARSCRLPLAFFAVGSDMAIPGNAERLRRLASLGHEIGNHSLDHCYDLTRLDSFEQRRQVGVGREVLQGATGSPVEGFRAPGYTMSDRLLSIVRETGHRYDSSVFPCAPYLLAKLAVLSWRQLQRRSSASIVGDPRVVLAPTSPYSPGVPYWTEGGHRSFLELPVQVTPRLRLPVIGTSLTLAPAPLARALVRACVGQLLINLEFHGIDALGEEDGLEALRGHQPDVTLCAAAKLNRLAEMVEVLREAGYRFVTPGEAARRQLGA